MTFGKLALLTSESLLVQYYNREGAEKIMPVFSVSQIFVDERLSLGVGESEKIHALMSDSTCVLKRSRATTGVVKALCKCVWMAHCSHMYVCSLNSVEVE